MYVRTCIRGARSLSTVAAAADVDMDMDMDMEMDKYSTGRRGAPKVMDICTCVSKC